VSQYISGTVSGKLRRKSSTTEILAPKPMPFMTISPAGLSNVREWLAGLPPLHYGKLKLHSRYLLSPLAGYTNLPFRRIVRGLGGVGLGTTDLVNARGLLDGGPKTLQLIETCPEDSPFAVQIFGHDPIIMKDAAQLLESRGVDSIDINMGCPVNRITKVGAGASMMCHADRTVVDPSTMAGCWSRGQPAPVRPDGRSERGGGGADGE